MSAWLVPPSPVMAEVAAAVITFAHGAHGGRRGRSQAVKDCSKLQLGFGLCPNDVQDIARLGLALVSAEKCRARGSDIAAASSACAEGRDQSVGRSE